MIINLNADFVSAEFVKLNARGKNPEKIDIVEISFNKEALIGFAKNLLWMYEDIDKNKRFYVCTDPLGGVPSGNQIVGFYLTSSSPTLILDVNSLDCEKTIKYDDRNTIHPKSKIKKLIEILPPVDDGLMEEYEIGFRNLLKMTLYNKNHMDITKDFYEVFFQINYEGLKNLALMLMKLADSYKEEEEYILAQVGEYNEICNSGIILTCDSLPVKLKFGNLGCVYDYEPDFGQ